MFLPILIAIIMGLAAPMHNSLGDNNATTLSTSSTGDDPTTDDGGHNGDNGQIPPPRP